MFVEKVMGGPAELEAALKKAKMLLAAPREPRVRLLGPWG